MIRSALGLKKKQGKGHDEEGADHPHHHQDSGHGGGHGDDESNWLVSYADMMTLLCGFFIMLFSMAKMDEPQFEKVQKAMAEQFGGEYHSPNEKLAKWVTQVLQDTPLKGEADVEEEKGGVAVIFRSQVFFDTLSAEITPSGTELLARFAQTLKERQAFEKKNFRFVVEGHTDARPVLSGPFATNWELSVARAARVVRVFLDQGFNPSGMGALGYADTRPMVPSKKPDGTWDEEALSKNRRVIIRIFHDSDRAELAALGEGPAPAERAPASTPPTEEVSAPAAAPSAAAAPASAPEAGAK